MRWPGCCATGAWRSDDAFLAKADITELSQRARLLKKQIAKKSAELVA